MRQKMTGWALMAIVAASVMAGWFVFRDKGPAPEAIAKAYATPLAPPEAPLRVFHLGHSLVGRDMPAMLAQLAGDGHTYESQLGWGTSLKEHWEPDLLINGFDAENNHPRYRDARIALASGDYGAAILTEMVEIKDAIKYHDSGKYLSAWAQLARGAAPAPRLYLYESWHKLDDPKGWLSRLDTDLGTYWEQELLFRDFQAAEGAAPIYVIPAGQVMAHFVRSVETMGGLEDVRGREDLFQRKADGTLDTIHVNDLGNYLVALTHYAVLYHRTPVGLPYVLKRADGSDADAPSAALAELMQKTVWEVVSNYPKTGVQP